MSHFSGHFEGASTFLTPKFKGSKKSWPPQNVPHGTCTQANIRVYLNKEYVCY
jgi:hypothetical protein